MSGLLLLYVLSVPPVMMLSSAKPSPLVRSFYSPLEYLYDHNPAVNAFYDWYFQLWGMSP